MWNNTVLMYLPVSNGLTYMRYNKTGKQIYPLYAKQVTTATQQVIFFHHQIPTLPCFRFVVSFPHPPPAYVAFRMSQNGVETILLSCYCTDEWAMCMNFVTFVVWTDSIKSQEVNQVPNFNIDESKC